MFDHSGWLGPRLREDEDAFLMFRRYGIDRRKRHGPHVRPVSTKHRVMKGDQSPNVNSDALPPAAVVFTVTVFSVANRGR